MEKRISGHTGLMALFGTPVGHSGSPAMYNFSFQHDGLDYAYMAFDVTEEEMPKVFESIRLLNMRGGNFTMPCKNIAAQLVDKLSPAAEIIGACNVFVNDDGVITGHITDGVGFVKNLELNGAPVKDKKVVVLGAGGAATAIQVQLALDGAKEVNIFNIKDKFWANAEETVKKIRENTDCIVNLYDLDDKDKLREEIADSYLFAQATGVGMKPLEGQTVVPDETYFRPDLIVTDTVYAPRETETLRLAKKAGCKTMNGLGMMLFQGDAAFHLWTGKHMPIDHMKEVLDIKYD